MLHRYVILYAVGIVDSSGRRVAKLDNNNRYAIGWSLSGARLRAWERGG